MITKERMAERIVSSMAIDNNGCWIWNKTVSNNGYGTFAFGGGKNARAHRISYIAFRGEVPPGMDVCHKCDVRRCVNPDHLFVGTRSENLLDASAKGRLPRTKTVRGSTHPSSKLTESLVGEILLALRSGEARASLSRRYAISQRVVLLISRGEAWKHVPRAAA